MSPNALTVVSQRYDSFIDSKIQAGQPRATAEDAAYSQIVQDGLFGSIDREAAIEFLTSLKIKSVASAKYAADMLRNLFDVSQRYESLVDSKIKAGLPRDTAEKAAYSQIVLSGQEGSIDRVAAIEFLMALEIKRGASAVGAAHIVKPLFAGK